MAYRHYETEGFVLGQLAQGEANKLYKVFTADFGLIFVSAQGVRLEKSKLRYNLQNYHLARFILVRGREFWRLTGVDRESGSNKNQIAFCHKIGLVLSRLIHGEEKNHLIFADLKNAWSLLKEHSLPLGEKGLQDLEILVLLRILFNLGYLASTPMLVPILEAREFTWEDVRGLENQRLSLVNIINSSLVQSGL